MFNGFEKFCWSGYDSVYLIIPLYLGDIFIFPNFFFIIDNTVWQGYSNFVGHFF